MGMAAGQARLLSITSRMSDNELRAQLINNSKLRLATESSQASEAYVTALNEAQMMFTNYGANNTSSYQQLSFNALTNYNQYNNQYGLSNASGQILVSETDAKNYTEANGSLEKFLSSYGLNKGTTYFDNLASKYTDSNGNVNDIGYKPDVLKAMYLGTNGYPGYQALLTSKSYFDFQDKTEKLTEEYDKLMENAGDAIKDVILNGNGDTYKINGEGFKSFLNTTETNNNSENGFNNNYYPGKINDFMVYLDKIAGDGKLSSGTNNALYKQLKGILGDALNKYGLANTDAKGNYVNNGSGYVSGNYGSGGVSNVKDTSTLIKNSGNQVQLIFDGTSVTVTKSDGTYSITSIALADPNPDEPAVDPSLLGLTAQISGSNLSVSQVRTDEDDDGNITVRNDIPEFNSTINLDEVFEQAEGLDTGKEFQLETDGYTFYQAAIEEDLMDTFKYAAELWEASYKYNINPTNFNVTGTGNFMAAGQDLATFLFGADSLDPKGPIKSSDYPSLMTFDGILALMEAEGYEGLTISEDFSNVMDLMTLENMMDLYGEPNVTWIDSTDKNASGNAEHKAQWYTNLFERMGNGTKNNFKVLADGLASSPEWIRFALESGMVTMEQVNDNNEWSTVMYSNISDITEQTNDTAVTIAEAEYKKAMNKIETKDKQFDMELKNIDTEHNSLQTEYDSIKTAIDKNIERTFKMYS